MLQVRNSSDGCDRNHLPNSIDVPAEPRYGPFTLSPGGIPGHLLGRARRLESRLSIPCGRRWFRRAGIDRKPECPQQFGLPSLPQDPRIAVRTEVVSKLADSIPS